MRHVAKSAIEAVRPAVVAAHERLLAACPARQLRAAVTAGVAKGAHLRAGSARGGGWQKRPPDGRLRARRGLECRRRPAPRTIRPPATRPSDRTGPGSAAAK